MLMNNNNFKREEITLNEVKQKEDEDIPEKIKPKNIVDAKYNINQICKLIFSLKKKKIKNPYDINFSMKKFVKIILNIKLFNIY